MKINKFDSPSGLKVKGSVPLHEDDRIKYNEKRCAYVILNTCEMPYPSLTVEQKLAFTITEIDVETEDDLGSYEEEYTELQPLSLATKDYLSSLAIPQG